MQMQYAKQKAGHHAAAVQHLNESVEHVREAAKHREQGELDDAKFHMVLAHMHGKYARQHHLFAIKAFTKQNSASKSKNMLELH
jgi:isopropylmalate/homocitrate/citramalate synthase